MCAEKNSVQILEKKEGHPMKMNIFEERIDMRYVSMVLAAGFLLFMAGVTTVRADTADEKKLNTEVITLDKDAGASHGQTVVTGRLEKEFKVTDTQIQSLRDKKLGYGEIAIVFSMAQKLGGINDTNINKILSMRQGPPVMGWGEIAKKLGFKLGPVVSQVKKVETASHKEIEKADKTEREKIGKGEERREEMRTERMEMERGGRSHGR
jgi:hypothetical protein